jgi:hypothetical protein
MWRKKWYLERNIYNEEKEVVFRKEYIKYGARSGIWKGIYIMRRK